MMVLIYKNSGFKRRYQWGCIEDHCLDFNSMTGETEYFFTFAGTALWVTTWFSGNGKYLEAFLSIITKRGD